MNYLPESQNILDAAQDEPLERKVELIQNLLEALAYLHRLVRVVDEEPDLIGVDARLRTFLTKMLAKQPAKRPITANDAIASLAESIGRPLLNESHDSRESYLQAAKFVGREVEMDRLTEALEETDAGTGSAWLISGESGVGRSRLIHELQTRAVVAGFQLAHGQGRRDNGGFFYQLWREPLRQLLVTAKQVDELTASILLPIVPDIAQLLGRDVNPAPELTAEAAQTRLFSTIAYLFRQAERPVLLILEDLHWASESFLPLPYLTRAVTEQQLLIIGTYRSDERPKLAETFPDMHSMSLTRLRPEAIAELSGAMLGEIGKQEEILALIQRETEGNAFFAVEVVRTLAMEAGRLKDIGTMTLPQTLFPQGIRSIVKRRLTNIPIAKQALLQLAAVAGRELDLDLLRLLDQQEQIPEWLTICNEAAVLEVLDGKWHFSHEKIREGLLAEMPNMLLCQHHRQVAQGLESLYGEDRDYAFQLSYHWRETGDAEKERIYAAVAGEEAASQYLNEEALGWFERCYTLTPTSEDAEKLSYLTAQARLHQILGQSAQHKQVLDEMVTLAETLAKPDLLASVLIERGYYYYYVGDLIRAEADIQMAIQYMKQTEDLSKQGVAYRTLGNLYFAQGLFGEALKAYERCLTLVNQGSDASAIAISSMVCGWFYTTKGNTIKAQTLLEVAETMCKDLNLKEMLAMTLINQACNYNHQGDLAQAEAKAEQSFPLAQSTGYKDLLGWRCVALGETAPLNGDEQKGLDYFTQAIGHLQANNNFIHLGRVSRYKGEIELRKQAYSEARADLLRALEIYRTIHNEAECAACRCGLARIAILEGREYEPDLTIVLEYMAKHPWLENTQRPFVVYLNAYRCLQNLEDSRAQSIIYQAHALLQKRAVQFEGEKRQRYLQIPVEHQEITRLSLKLPLGL